MKSLIDVIFASRQMEENFLEQRRPLYIALMELAKAFDLASRSELFNLSKCGCSPNLLNIIASFHGNMLCTLQFDSFKTAICFKSETNKVAFSHRLCLACCYHCYSANHSCSLVEVYTFTQNAMDASPTYHAFVLKPRSGKFSYARDATLVSQTEVGLQRLMDCLKRACGKFRLTIIKKTNILC